MFAEDAHLWQIIANVQITPVAATLGNDICRVAVPSRARPREPNVSSGVLRGTQ
jgi:hypothetical protein